MKDNREDYVLIICGLEQISLHYDIRSFLKEFAALKVALPGVTFIGFVNYDALSKKDIALFESMATTVVRIEGVVDLANRKIRKYIYMQ